MSDQKQDKRDESAWVAVARYSEIGFIIPASVMVGYFFGWLADRSFHTHWLYLFGIIFGAVSGFVTMIRRALKAESDEEADERKDEPK